jgi:hypothetical protein
MAVPCWMTLLRFQKLDQNAKGITQIKTADTRDRALGDRGNAAGELATTGADAFYRGIEIPVRGLAR